MRCVVMPEAMRAELARCTKVAVKGKASVQSCIEMHAYGASLSLRAQDSDVSFVSAVNVTEIKESGGALVDCDRLAAVLAVRPDGTAMTFWTEGVFLHVKQGEFRVKLPLLRSGSMSETRFDVPFDIDLTLPVEVLRGIRRVAHFVEEDSQFPGLMLDFTEAGVLRVAAFTRALTQVAHFDVPFAAGRRIILAPRAFALFDSMPDTSFRFAFSKAKSKAYVFASTFAMRVACLDDIFPVSYQQVLGLYRWRDHLYPVTVVNNVGNVVSEQPRNKIVFSRSEMLAAMECAAIALGKEEPTVELRIGQKLEDGRVVVEVIGKNTATKANASEKILARGSLDAAIALGLNYANFRDLLKHQESAEVVLHVGRKDDPVAVTENPNPHIVSIVSLMRL